MQEMHHGSLRKSTNTDDTIFCSITLPLFPAALQVSRQKKQTLVKEGENPIWTHLAVI